MMNFNLAQPADGAGGCWPVVITQQLTMGPPGLSATLPYELEPALRLTQISDDRRRRPAGAFFDLAVSLGWTTCITRHAFPPQGALQAPCVTVGVASEMGEDVGNRPVRQPASRPDLFVT